MHLRIVHVTPYFRPHLGYEEYYLSREQLERNHEVYVITSDRYGPYRDPAKPYLEGRFAGQGIFIEEGIKVYRLPCVFELGVYVLVKGMRKVLEDLKPDLIHAHGVHTVICSLPSFFKKRIGYKYLIDNHAFLLSSLYNNLQGKLLYGTLKNTLFKYAISKSDQISAITPACGKLFSDEYGIPLQDIHISPLGADVNFFKTNLHERRRIRECMEIEKDEILIVTVGKIEPLRKIEYLFRSASDLIRKGEKIRIILMGTGLTFYMNKLKRLAFNLGISEKVIFYGYVHRTRMPSFYSASDIAVWPSSRTIAMIEAMAMGLPLVIARKWPAGGYPYSDDVYERGLVAYENGLCFEAGSIRELTICLKTLIDNEKTRKNMGKRSRRLAEEHFNWSIIANKYLNLYKKLF